MLSDSVAVHANGPLRTDGLPRPPRPAQAVTLPGEWMLRLADGCPVQALTFHTIVTEE